MSISKEIGLYLYESMNLSLIRGYNYIHTNVIEIFLFLRKFFVLVMQHSKIHDSTSASNKMK